MALRKVPWHLPFWPQINVNDDDDYDEMLCDCKIAFIAAPSGECLPVAAAVITLHLFDPVTLALNLLTLNEMGDQDLSCVIHLPSWWWYVKRFLFQSADIGNTHIHTHTHAHTHTHTHIRREPVDYVGVSADDLMHHALFPIGVGDGGKGGTCPPKFGQKYFFGQKSCKIRHFVKFFGQISRKIRAFC